MFLGGRKAVARGHKIIMEGGTTPRRQTVVEELSGKRGHLLRRGCMSGSWVIRKNQADYMSDIACKNINQIVQSRK